MKLFHKKLREEKKMALGKRLRKEKKMTLGKKLRRKVGRKIGRRLGRLTGKLLGKLAAISAVAFVSTFVIYIFNLENKLIYHVIYPFLQNHYNAQTRDRKI